MGRSPCCDKVGLKKGTWTAEEDQKLLTYIERYGHGSWSALPAKAGLQRCGKSCRLRWTNYLRPDIKRGKFSSQEEQTIIQLHALLGNRWSAIAAHLPKRTDNEIKNYWNTHLKKRLMKMGIDPATHKPMTNGQQIDTADLIHAAQWESARLEAEARLVRESKLMSSININPHQTKPTFLPHCIDILKFWKGTLNTNPTAFFTSSGTLQPPTSTLNFSDNIFTMPRTTFFSENFSFPLINYVENSKENGLNNWNVCSKRASYDHHHKLEVGNKMEMEVMNNTLQLDDIENLNPVEAAAYVADESLRHPSFIEGFAGILSNDSYYSTGPLGSFQNLDSSCGGELDDNRKYWNSIYSNLGFL